MSVIAEALQTIQRRITTAAKSVGRPPATIRLVAISKGKPATAVRMALIAGQRIFGENRVQEARAKYTSLRDDYPDLQLHLIGPLQTNKVDDAVTLFDVIETLDRVNLADALAHAIKKTRRSPRFYVEINIGEEPQKSGIVPAELDRFLVYCRDQCGLAITGLMCIPPHKHDPAPYFVHMKALAAQHELSELSMGMSADFETAIRHGATEVRVGRAIFGDR